jgi:GT2 family glycosyltransferase
MQKVAVVILNWNTKEHLKTFLPSVIKYTLIKGVKIFVADNGSDDDSVNLLNEYFPEVGIIEMERNYGFSKAYNMALAKLEAEYFVLLNSDVEVTENWLQPMISVMDRDKLVAATMPKIRSYEQKDFFEYAGAAGGFIDKYGYPFCRGRVFESLEMDFGQYDAEADIFWATGACMMVRAVLFKLSGGLDEFFFAHFEEIDLCWRLKNRGYQVRFVPSSKVYHLGGGTLPKTSSRKTFLNYRNNLLLLLKNLPDEKLFSVLMRRLVLDGISSLRFLLKAELGNYLAVFKAHFAFYKKIQYYKNFRKEEKKFITRNYHKEIYSKSIVNEYFIKKKYTFASLKWKV